jgi:hypothetical protein
VARSAGLRSASRSVDRVVTVTEEDRDFEMLVKELEIR